MIHDWLCRIGLILDLLCNLMSLYVVTVKLFAVSVIVKLIIHYEMIFHVGHVCDMNCSECVIRDLSRYYSIRTCFLLHNIIVLYIFSYVNVFTPKFK